LRRLCACDPGLLRLHRRRRDRRRRHSTAAQPRLRLQRRHPRRRNRLLHRARRGPPDRREPIMTDTTATRWIANYRSTTWSSPDPDDAPLDFHRGLDGYAPTALIALPKLAREHGVAAVYAKDESTRQGLPAFTAIGASKAVQRALAAHQTDTDAEVVTATDGNHGRAVARFARKAGHPARIF